VQNEIRVVELFAGVGGFRCGLEAASKRFVTVWANQWEPGKKSQHAFNCYNEHFKDTESKNVNEDIGKVKSDIPEHDLLVGGFPCQDYSVASTNARGIEGKKGVLWWHINDIIKARGPRYVLLENVDRLLKSPAKQRGRDFGIILRCLADDGYTAEWRVINAADYGKAQRRRRIFIFARKNDSESPVIDRDDMEAAVSRTGFFARTFPVDLQPICGRVNSFDISEREYETLVDVSKHFTEPLFSGGIMSGYTVYTRECKSAFEGKSIPLSKIMQDSVDEKYYVKDIAKWEYLKGSKHIKRKRKADGVEYNYSEGAIPCPDPIDRPGRTMLTSEGTINRSSHIVKDKATGRIRILTPIECERLNGFSDDWTKTMPERARYFTMGNALVVPLIEDMGRSILSLYDQDHPDDDGE
jgi:DNA (cytosine-5)-methyltransferase 1